MSNPKIKIEQIHKELDLIQGVISRMASNSFEVKKWLIGILSAIIVFDQTEMLGGNMELVWILYLPILSFWYLDAFFLSTEKLYRELYKWVVDYRSHTVDYLYDLNTFDRNTPGEQEMKKIEADGALKVMFSKTIWPFYLIPFLFITAYWLVPILLAE